MRKFKFEKLVRDKIPDKILINKKNKIDFKILNKKEFLKSLRDKFFEELEELDLNSKDDAVKELADLQLIIDSCLEALEIKQKDFKKIFKNKNIENGKFSKRIYIKTVEIDKNDKWLPYYESKYNKYKEIK
ncbi:MAG: nucleoside triphosphate pyrophosphohydrolase [Candidatus Shapirobacteria bacterium]|nr:nucleoside triphosphate pyrophosphohydrolase [Candidatus Shapirobacteria bacterium]